MEGVEEGDATQQPPMLKPMKLGDSTTIAKNKSTKTEEQPPSLKESPETKEQLPPPPKELTALELCGGCGGLAHAARELGFNHAAIIEPNKRCAATLFANGFDNVVQAKIEDVDFSHYKGVTLLTAGLPCQPWSVGGQNTGEDDPRNLWIHAIRAVQQAQPKLFLFEMVRGFLRPRFERIRDHLIQQLSQLGYLVEIAKVNATDYGIPLHRT